MRLLAWIRVLPTKTLHLGSRCNRELVWMIFVTSILSQFTMLFWSSEIVVSRKCLSISYKRLVWYVFERDYLVQELCFIDWFSINWIGKYMWKDFLSPYIDLQLSSFRNDVNYNESSFLAIYFCIIDNVMKFCSSKIDI